METIINITLFQLAITVVIAVLPIVALAWNINTSRRKEFKKLYDDKADREATDERLKVIHHRINDKADKSAIEQMSSKIDMIYKQVVKN